MMNLVSQIEFFFKATCHTSSVNFSTDSLLPCQTYFSNNIFDTGSQTGIFLDGPNRKLHEMNFREIQTKIFAKNRLHFFNQCLDRLSSTFKMLFDCSLLCLVSDTGNMVRGSCQNLHTFVITSRKFFKYFQKILL